MTGISAAFSGIVAPLPLANVDTDQIIPARYLRGTGREGLGPYLFAGSRYRQDGTENPEFILNRQPYRRARILVSHENFGCGSSREHAVWALRSFGITCVVAPSFADIFFGNCCRNGLVALRLERSVCDALIADAVQDPEGSVPHIDLEAQQLTHRRGDVHRFMLDPAVRADLLGGIDAIERTIAMERAIVAFEQAHLPGPFRLPPLRFD